MANLGYEANVEKDVQEYKAGFEVIEPGWKKVVIVGSEIKDTRAGNGKMLILTDELQDGTKRTLTDRLNIFNPSEKAQIIGRAALAKIAQSVGHKGTLTDSKVLHGRPFEVKIEIEEFESNTEPGKMLKSNKISDYRRIEAATAPATTDKAPDKAPVGW